MFRLVGFIAIICLVAPGSSRAGDFGIRTKSATQITISRPPDAMLRGKTLAIKSKEGVAFKDRAALELAIEQALASEFTPTKGAADMTMTVAVSSYEPVIAKNTVVNENRNVVIGKKTIKNILTGKPLVIDEYGNRPVPVTYWEARGALSLQVSVNDSSGALIDSFTPQSQYSRKVETAENRVAKKTETLPTAQELQAALIKKVADDIQKRYTKVNETADAPLAVDSDLRAGNGLAAAGQWKEAIAAWSPVQMRKNQGDKAYNMAVAYEALAYKSFDESRNPEDSEASLQQATKLYEEALRLDPGEKVFRQAMDRCAAMKANFARAKDQYAAQQRGTQVALVKAEAKQQVEEAKRQQQADMAKELDSKRPDSQDEADFRAIIRGRLRALSAPPGDDAQAQMVQFGKAAYKLENVPAQRVVHQEVDRLQRVKANLELYRQTFADFVGSDKTLDAGERANLTQLAKRLELTDQDVKPIEAQFQFKDLTAASPQQQPAAESPAPPPAQKPKPVAPRPRPAKPAAPPAPDTPGIKPQ